MAVQIRERKIKGGVSLYWDFYINGQRFTRTSSYRLYNDEPKTLSKKKKDTAIREGYMLEMEYLTKGVDKIHSIESKGEASFNLFLHDIRDTRKTESTKSNWGTIIKRFETFAGKNVKFKNINTKLCQDYLDHLLSRQKDKLVELKNQATSPKEIQLLDDVRGLESLLFAPII